MSEPFIWTPDNSVGSFVDDVGELAENLGRPLYPHQVTTVDALTRYDRFGKFTTIEACVEGPRQSVGKTGGIILPIVLWSALTDRNHYIWTAHLYDTAAKVFLELAKPETGMIDTIDWLRRRISTVSYRNNAEGITFKNGSQLDFRSRSGKRSRGLSAANIVFDEWLYGTHEMTGAALPVMATFSQTGNARAYYASSSAKMISVALRELKARALSKDPTLSYVGFWAPGSWSDPGCENEECSHKYGTNGCALDNEELWMAANPTLPKIVSFAFMRTMRRTMDPLDFGREFLGWGEQGDGLAEPLAWAGLSDPHSKPQRWPVAIGVDVGPRQKVATVVAAGYREDGLLHVEVMASAEGTRWLRDFLESKQNATDATVFHLGGTSPVMSTVGSWKNTIQHVKVSDSEYAAGCGSLNEHVASQTLRHLGDGVLAKAVQSAVRRNVGDGSFVLSRSLSGGDITPAVAMALAIYGLENMPNDGAWGYVE